MRINLISIGRITNDPINELIRDYEKRLQRFTNYATTVHTGVKNAKNLSSSEIKRKEAKIILDLLDKSDVVILLDERGKLYTSEDFSHFITAKANMGVKSLAFVIGGAYGFDQSVYDLAKTKISLSKMTFPHTLAKLFFTEQLYRAFTITAGHPYHNT